MKKFICVCMALCVLLCFVGCKSNTETNSSFESEHTPQSNVNAKTINLLYTYGDTFNPYTATTSSNRQLATLLYDSLVKTDNNFNVECVLAQSFENGNKVCTLKLRDATFTDGSAVTAEDVIYSYNLAKENDLYKNNFYEVTSVSAVDSKTVVFNLSQYDEYFVNLITFPIVKKGTSGVTDTDGKEIAPIGCGRYYVAEDRLSFKLNNNYYGNKGVIETINLINSPDMESTSHYVEIGATHMYYTDGDNIVRMSGKKTEVNLNRIIYIGVNSSYGSLQTKEMRYAISSALDRSAICQSAYYNNAVSAKGFFNPCFEPVSAVQTIESESNSKITVENLAKIGYINMNSSGFYANESGNNPEFTLLVNSENASRVAAANLIASQCKAAGILINVVECSYEQYVARLESGSFQLYLGEIQILNNMDFTNLVVSGGSAAYGVGFQNTDNVDNEETETLQGNPCENIIKSYHQGECSISDVAATLLTEMPQIPVCYLNGVLFYDSDITNGVTASTSDIYLSIQNYEF